MWMHAEYSTALDGVALYSLSEGGSEIVYETKYFSGNARRERTHAAILQVTQELILRCQPWNRDLLADLAEISPGTLYNHFPSTHHIIVDAYAQLLARQR